LQFGAVPVVQVPLWHVSAPLHALPSLQEVPLATLVAVHPVAGTQASVVQALPSLQVSGVPAVQVPPWQVSPPLHRLPSEHDEPLATATFWQPVAGLQLSVVQTLESLHVRAVPLVHVPPWHVSAPLQTFASAQEVPLATLVTVQPVVALHPSVVHGLLSLQMSGVPAVQVPA
jgi:hypothetical protein